MKRSELQRKTPLRSSRAGIASEPRPSRAKGSALRTDAPARRSTLKPGRGFAASPVQREKVKGMACVGCGAMQNEWTIIDPMHLCARGMGGCDDPLCVVPGCRTATGGCHPAFDEGELDLIAKLEPAHRAEVAHAVMHLGLEGTRRRLAPSLYERRAAGTEAAA